MRRYEDVSYRWRRPGSLAGNQTAVKDRTSCRMGLGTPACCRRAGSERRQPQLTSAGSVSLLALRSQQLGA